MPPELKDLKSTINLPKTAFPMKANLPQNEPKMLARWEQEKLYDRIRARAQRLARLRPPRRPALHQRPHPPRHGDEQMSQGLHRQVENHVRLRRALRPRLGLPRAAHRNQSRQGTRRQEAPDARPLRAQRLSQVRAKISRLAAHTVQAHRCLRPFRSIPTRP